MPNKSTWLLGSNTARNMAFASTARMTAAFLILPSLSSSQQLRMVSVTLILRLCYQLLIVLHCKVKRSFRDRPIRSDTVSLFHVYACRFAAIMCGKPNTEILISHCCTKHTTVAFRQTTAIRFCRYPTSHSCRPVPSCPTT